MDHWDQNDQSYHETLGVVLSLRFVAERDIPEANTEQSKGKENRTKSSVASLTKFIAMFFSLVHNIDSFANSEKTMKYCGTSLLHSLNN